MAPSWLNIHKNHRERVPSSNQIHNLESTFKTKTGTPIPISLSCSAIIDNHGRKRGYVLIARNISSRRELYEELETRKRRLEDLVEKRSAQLVRANDQIIEQTLSRIKVENEQSTLQTYLFQSQKMEAIGRLAGGVAHDFNNLIYVISDHSETIRDSIRDSDPEREVADEIQEVVDKTKNLIDQLLAFSRKQTARPTLVDLKAALVDNERMLGRIVGNSIPVYLTMPLKLGRIRIDPIQLNQILGNLFINARDAMPNGGSITVTASNVTVTDIDFHAQPGFLPGKYVRLRISDTGCGMTREIASQAFEPFFTTKETGKGTGLGLSTVYGIVKQNMGYVYLDTAKGKGAAFELYFPMVEMQSADEPELPEPVPPSGTETILLVEDDDKVRKIAAHRLSVKGYTVISAANAAHAMDIFYAREHTIHLVFTDIVMPGMSGKALKEKIRQTDPDMKVLYMSGHNDEIIDSHGVIEDDTPLLQKPFSSNELYWKVREVLDA